MVIFASKTSRGMLPCLTQFSTVRQARIRQDDVKARTVSDTSHEVEMTQQWQHVYQFENHNHFKRNTHQYTTLIYFVSASRSCDHKDPEASPLPSDMLQLYAY